MTITTISGNSKILNRVSYTQIEDELTLFFRNNLTDRRSRTLNKTETFTPDGDTAVFELTGDLDNKDRHKVMNIRSVSIDGVSKTFYTDYICGFKLTNTDLTISNPDLGKIRFWNAPTGTSISVNYDYAYTFIWPQNNRVDISTIDYPRVTVDTSGAIEDLGIGGTSTVHNLITTIVCMDIKIEGVRALIQQIKNLFINESIRKGFHNFTYIMVNQVQEGPNLNSTDTNDVVYEQTITLSIPYQFEFSQ